jgi:hypothetical protein
MIKRTEDEYTKNIMHSSEFSVFVCVCVHVIYKIRTISAAAVAAAAAVYIIIK